MGFDCVGLQSLLGFRVWELTWPSDGHLNLGFRV